MRASLPDSTFRQWLEPLRIVAARGSTLYITSPKQVRSWAERRYGDLLQRTVSDHAPYTEIRFVDEPDPGDSRSAARAAAGLAFNPEHTFERFVIGPGNRLAHAAALSVAEAPGQAYNPLFLNGPPGLGKTHLLGAIANYLRVRSPQLGVRYTTAECFTNNFVAALQSASIEHFKEQYRTVDVLLIDDVEFLEGKARTADELFHTFNALYERGAQIVLSADRLPSELSELARRLRDRFEWGLVTELRAPDELTRLTFLNRISQEERLRPAEPEAITAVAARVIENLRLLRGAWTRVVAVSSLTGSPITRRLVDSALPGDRETQPSTEPSTALISAEAVQTAVCQRLDVDPAQLLSQSRKGSVVEARQAAMYLTRRLTDLSLARIAYAFNRHDHTTVLHALKRVQTRLQTEPQLAATLAELERSLANSTPVRGRS